jgi:hypothetical protein
LKRKSADGKAVKQIVYAGERFDVMSVRQHHGTSNCALLRKTLAFETENEHRVRGVGELPASAGRAFPPAT